MKQFTFICFVFFIAFSFNADAQKNITLEDIWQDYKFSPKSVPGFNFLQDGKHYTRLIQGKIEQYDLATGEKTATLFDAKEVKAEGFGGRINAYSFSADERKIIVSSDREQIYRHSSRSNYFIYDRASKMLEPVFTEGKHQYATLNPQADKVAFVYNNNMYYKDLTSGKITQMTTDGKYNKIINGAPDWVYEEEFSFHIAFEWSPDGEKIAFFKFDESEVKEFTMTNYRDDLYPEYVTFKYPKVGEKNAIVTIHIYDVKSNKTIDAAVTTEEEYYIPRIKWTTDPDQLCVTRLNRHQNDLRLLLVNANNGKAKELIREVNKYYIDIDDNLTFLQDGKHFLWTSEMDGWHHIYKYDMNGQRLGNLTKGKWDVTSFYGIDEKNGLVYYQAAKNSPMDREIYTVDLNGKNATTITDQDGWNSAQFSSTFDYYVLSHSTINTPTTYTVYNRDNQEVRVIENNARLSQVQDNYGTQEVEFFSFTNREGTDLNGYFIKPKDFDENKKYPVFMYLYGGPGSQQVTNSWKGQNYWWFQMLAQQGYMIACVDNRGTGARGEEFKKMTYMQLGKYETEDQIDAANYLARLKYTDPNRIGIFGWSYGGYMSSLCLLKGNDIFSAAIAVAPVTNWKWYDTIYTERYMRTEKENGSGYRNNSPVYFARQLEGDYLLVHGMGDDNVHFQNTAEMANALVQANKQFETYFYPNRNHGIYGGPTRLHLYKKMTDFLDRKLKGNEGKAGKQSNQLIKSIKGEKMIKE